MMLTVVKDVISPEVPAAHWVKVGINCLRVDYDDVVQFSDLVVASVSNKLLSNIPPKYKRCNRPTLSLFAIGGRP